MIQWVSGLRCVSFPQSPDFKGFGDFGVSAAAWTEQQPAPIQSSEVSGGKGLLSGRRVIACFVGDCFFVDAGFISAPQYPPKSRLFRPPCVLPPAHTCRGLFGYCKSRFSLTLIISDSEHRGKAARQYAGESDAVEKP